EDVDASTRVVGSVQAGPPRVDGGTGVDGAGSRHLDRRCQASGPTRNRTVQVCEDETSGCGRGPWRQLGGGGIGVVGLTRWSLGAGPRGRDTDKSLRIDGQYLTDGGGAHHGIESRGVRSLVRGPEWAREASRHAPGVDQERIGDGGQTGDVRDEVRLKIPG